MSISVGRPQTLPTRQREPTWLEAGPPHAVTVDLLHAVIHARRSVSPRRLVEPGPSEEQLQRMFNAAATAPDHGMLTPWRFVIVPPGKRSALGEAFALALIDRDPGATLEQIENARAKAERAPFLMLCVARLGGFEPDMPSAELLVSLGCAIQNILLSAEADGLGAGLTSGRALQSAPIRALFALAEGEEAVCFVNVGTVSKSKPSRVRPAPEQFVSALA